MQSARSLLYLWCFEVVPSGTQDQKLAGCCRPGTQQDGMMEEAVQHFAGMLLEQRLRTSKDRLAVRELLLARGFELSEASKPSSAISATALQIGWAHLPRNGGLTFGVGLQRVCKRQLLLRGMTACSALTPRNGLTISVCSNQRRVTACRWEAWPQADKPVRPVPAAAQRPAGRHGVRRVLHPPQLARPPRRRPWHWYRTLHPMLFKRRSQKESETGNPIVEAAAYA